MSGAMKISVSGSLRWSAAFNACVRLESLRDASQIIDRFLALPRGYHATPLGHDRKSQKSAPIGDEAREQKRGWKRVGMWAPDGETQRHSRINKKSSTISRKAPRSVRRVAHATAPSRPSAIRLAISRVNAM
jgi:hypothetical protein